MDGKHERPEKPTPDSDPWFGFLNQPGDDAGDDDAQARQEEGQ